MDCSSLTFEERNCCGSDTFDPSVAAVTCEIDDGRASGGNDINAAAVIGTVAAVCALILVCCVARRFKTRKSTNSAAKEPGTPPEIVTEP